MFKKVFFGIQPRILIMFLILSLAPVIVGVWILFSHSEGCFIDVKGNEMSNLSEIAVQEVQNHLKDLASQADTLSFNYLLLENVIKSNQALPADDQAAMDQARALNDKWATLTPENPDVQQVISGPLPTYLKKFITIYNAYSQIVILNRIGAVVAATDMPERYFHGGENWWNKAAQHYIDYGGYISDVQYTQSLKMPFRTEISIPIFNPQRNFIGMILCTVQITDLDRVVRPFKFGNTGQVVVVSTDGTIISSQKFDLTNQETYDYFSQIQPALEKNPKPFLLVTDSGRIVRMVGIPQSRIEQAFPELKWYLFTVQDYEDAMSPVYGLKSTAMVYIIVVILIVLLLAFWFSRELTKPIMELDMHLEKL